jgi:hypothetical protein
MLSSGIQTFNYYFHSSRSRGPLMLLWFLLTLVAFSKPIAAQTNRPFSPGLLVFDAELGGPIQEQAVIMNNYTGFDVATATTGRQLSMGDHSQRRQ